MSVCTCIHGCRREAEVGSTCGQCLKGWHSHHCNDYSDNPRYGRPVQFLAPGLCTICGARKDEHPQEEEDRLTEEKTFRRFRRFHLVRDEDISGTSGVGVVAEGTLFSNNKAVLTWTTKYTSVAVYDSLAEMEAIHGHEGKTRIVWVDPE